MAFWDDAADWAGGAWDSLTGQYDPSSVPDLQAQTRGDQRLAQGQLQGWAFTGQGPSAAQSMIEHNRAANAGMNIGAAKSMGGDPALANRNAANAIAQGNAAATYQGGIIRATEQQQAMQNYLNSLNATRAQDMNYQNAMYGIGQGNAANEQQAWMSLLGGLGKAAGGAATGMPGGGAGATGSMTGGASGAPAAAAGI